MLKKSLTKSLSDQHTFNLSVTKRKFNKVHANLFID